MTERIAGAHESECVTERCERDIHTDRQTGRRRIISVAD